MKDVAALAGVSIKTVSRVINSEPAVSPQALAQVTRAIDQLGYQHDAGAGSLRRRGRRTATLGLIVSSVSNPFAASLHRAVEDAAIQRGYAVFASSIDDDPVRERSVVNAMFRRRIDGLLLTPASDNQSYLSAEQSYGTPVVFMDRSPVGVDSDAVVSQHARGAAVGTRHLLDHGHRHIAYLGDRSDIQTAAERRRGFVEALSERGIASSSVPIIENLHDEKAAETAALMLLQGPQRPTAIFSSQNLVTLGLVRALRRLNLHHQIGLVGFDDVPQADLLEPAITVVAQRPDIIGQTAVERLFARMDGDESKPSTHVIATELITRGSGEIRPTR